MVINVKQSFIQNNKRLGWSTNYNLNLEFIPAVVSDKPVSLRTSKIEFNQVGVLWYAPINDRGISGFQLVLSDVDGGGMAELNTPPILQYTLSGLKPDREYTFSVTSQLGDHEGKTSELLSFRTLPFG